MMLSETPQRNNTPVSYSLDSDTLTVSVAGKTTEYTFSDDGFMADPPFPIVSAERRNGELAVTVIRTLDPRGEPNESEPGTPSAGVVDWQPWPTPTVDDLVLYTRRLARDKVQAALGINADDDEVLVLSEQLRRNAVATARLSRLEKGQGRQNDRAALDALEPMANAIEPIDAARDAIIAEISDPADPQNPRFTVPEDIDTAAEWP